MILKISIENWMSFKDPVEFSMVASKERQHGERLPRSKKYQMRMLPVSAIYGGNASGKTNFFKALNFTKNLVVKGTHPDSMIGVDPFKLDQESVKKPSKFSFELLLNETIYEFSFSVTRREIVEERLIEILSTSEKTLYSRKGGKIEFEDSLNKDKFLEFAFRGTRDNQLFLTNSVNQKVDYFKQIYDWFRNDLVLIAPDSRFEPFEQFLEESHPLYSTMNSSLANLDTGIVQLGSEEVPWETIPLPEPLKTQLSEDLKEGMSVRMLAPFNDRYVFTRKNGEISAKRLVTYHQGSDGKEIKFEMQQESDGSQRVIDLLPAFLEMGDPKATKVYIIDEVDRSLHTLLTQQLISGYLDQCDSESRTQLLFTTHDVLLMDQDIFRRDEMWVAERDQQGRSSLLSFSEYKDVRYDKDVRKSYLQGRLGGTPKIFISGALSNNVCADRFSEAEC